MGFKGNSDKSDRHYASGENRYDFFITNGEVEYDMKDFYPNNQTNDYECPNCEEILFTNEEDAKEFLCSK